ncbi:MAG: LOG family protein, partial [Gammaproteobacteria bacterium]|nr:LOG family protein [Gammaproteobacteria bacterium]
VLNVDGFYDGMQRFLDHCVAERFIRAEHRAMLISAAEPARLLDALRNYDAPQVRKWLDRKSSL